MVGGDHIVAEPLPQLVGQPLRQPTGVDEHDGGAVAGHQLGDPVEHVAHLRRGGHRLELAVGDLDGDVERPPVPGVDDRAVRPAVRARAGADEEPGDHLDRLLRGRQAHPRRCTAQTWASRSSVRQRWLPRLSRASAWISSTITVSTVRRVARLRVAVTRR